MARKAQIRYKGRSQWCNTETGEIQEFDEFEKPVGRDEPFMITYAQEIIKLMDVLGNRKMQIARYILENMKKADNTVLITTMELAEKVGASRTTVSETLKILEEAGLIQRKTGAIMLNPRLLNNKKADGEAQMIIRFHQFGKKPSEKG